MTRPSLGLLQTLVLASLLAGCGAPQYKDEDTWFYSGPPTQSTCFWEVPAYSYMKKPLLGPEQAKGVILYSHGQRAKGLPGWTRPPVKIIKRRFADTGWDVIKVQRNERCTGRWDVKGGSYIKDFVQRVQSLKEAGYRKIVVAGQSVGTAVALGSSAHSTDIDGVLAFALSHGRGSCRRPDQFRYSMISFHEHKIKKAIRAAQAPRIVIVLAKDGHCIGHSFTPTVNVELSKKLNVAWIYLDETSAVPGHGAANRAKFNRIYGQCLHDFINDDVIEPRRHTCPAE